MLIAHAHAHAPVNAVCKIVILQVRVEVYDTAWPDNRVNADLTIKVNRNPTGPIFSPNNQYDQTIRANFDLGGVVIQLEASDPDGVSS